MKKNVFYLIFVVLLLLKETSVCATVYEGVCGENLTWTLNSEDSTLVISGRGAMTDMQFGSESFRIQSKLTKYVVFPEGLTSINDNAFGGQWNSCENLQSVTLPDSVVYVGKKAFWGCIGIKEVRCGKGLKSICDSAFFFCENMKHLELSDSLESIGISAFSQDTALQGTIVFPESLKYIGSNAFGVYSTEARKLTAIWKARHCNHVRFSSGGWGAPLRSFSKIEFGEHVENIPDYLCSSTFSDTITLPESVDSIGEYAFGWNKNLKHIEMPSSLSYIGECTFYYCNNLSSLRIPEGISVIPNGFAAECTALSELSLPSTLDSIMGSTFNYCTALTHITLPAGTKFIGEFAFSCSNLQHINLPEGLTSIGKSAFRTCPSLESVTIPESITHIDEYTFADCSVLHEVNMSNSIRQIGVGAFRNCSLDTLILPSELNVIGTGAFQNQMKLTEIVIPDEVRQVMSRAFENCTGLRKVLIGKKTAMIDSEAFKNDSAIIEIRSRAAYPPVVVNETFTGVPDSAWLYVPVQSIDAYADDPVWGRFRMEKAEEVKYVSVEAEETTANFIWPTDSTAYSYQIDIYKDGNVFCKLTLGNRGQLLGISFSAPGRRMAQQNTADSSQPYTLSFMVTGLDEASRYNYVLSALDENGTPLHVYTGDFATTGYQGELKGGGDEVIPTPPIIPSNPEAQTATGMEGDDSRKSKVEGRKLLRNGQLLFIIDGAMYNAEGKRVR